MMVLASWLSALAGLAALLGWISSFYLFAQYILSPKHKSRFSRGSSLWGGGWFLWLIGFVLVQSASDNHAWGMAVAGDLCIAVGAGCIVSVAWRYRRERVREKRAKREAEPPAPPDGSVWPPPPSQL